MILFQKCLASLCGATFQDRTLSIATMSNVSLYNKTDNYSRKSPAYIMCYHTYTLIQIIRQIFTLSFMKIYASLHPQYIGLYRWPYTSQYKSLDRYCLYMTTALTFLWSVSLFQEKEKRGEMITKNDRCLSLYIFTYVHCTVYVYLYSVQMFYLGGRN